MKASPQGLVWISEADVISVMNIAVAIEALENGLTAEAHGEATNMLKTHAAWNASTLHAIGAVFPKMGFAGTKTWAHTSQGASPLLILFDSANGAVRAVIEAFYLGKMRTAAASGVATRRLAHVDADDLAIIGTGKQAFSQVAAVAAVRPLRRIRVFSPNAEHRMAFAENLKKEFAAEVVVAAGVAEAVQGASIITTVTRTKDPFLQSGMIERGAHINAVGAILPGRAELMPDVVPRCTQIVCDSPTQAQKLSTELIDHFKSDPHEWNRVRGLAELVVTNQERRNADDLTLLKLLGAGVLDLSVGIEVFQRVRKL
ncbi:MAG TPA: ornithine cyclodeaminase family protein [Terriglobia bacterium]|nr:ornithine cyclodeaminase family protein [Terriglobia bacterium]